ncbi:DUF2938 domain-containing protein [Bradyrhizobium sp. LjRoot220]|uniref:DUF2938 domain-containing protein n=1 Tax=Bradyrhizobium sp. LjRoot220 TaxID=3342284 RepID=UPI003ED09AC4
MSIDLVFVMAALLIGVGATLFMDLWAALLKRLLGVQPLNYAFVGRWIGHAWLGRFSHESIAAAPAIRGEAALGWFAHYAIGVIFTALLLAIWGIDWARNPTPGPALFVGIATVAAPFLILQPGMGLGIAARKTPQPNISRFRSLATHVSFGLGLYAAALIVATLLPA